MVTVYGSALRDSILTPTLNNESLGALDNLSLFQPFHYSYTAASPTVQIRIKEPENSSSNERHG
jgi:hypothetical protein